MSPVAWTACARNARMILFDHNFQDELHCNGASVADILRAEPSYDILAFLQTLRQPGQVFEIRALDCPERKGRSYRKIASGYYTDFEKAVAGARHLNSLEPAGVYVTINRCKPEALARSANALKWNAK